MFKELLDADEDPYDSWPAYAAAMRRAALGGQAHPDRGAYCPDPDEIVVRAYALRLLTHFFPDWCVRAVMYQDRPTPARFIETYNAMADLQHIKARIEKLQTMRDQAQGRLEVALSGLKAEFDVGTLEEAEDLAKELQAEADEAKDTADKALARLDKKWGHLWGT